ncbi:hypothetical protein [Pseudomonas viridiflava]|nr:hypothetical protein [Pseudomonas viridiflava]
MAHLRLSSRSREEADVVVDENGKPAQVLTEANLQSYHFDEQKNVNPNA